MNMMPNQDFANNLEATGLDKTNGSNPALARLMQAWESKQGKNAKKAGGLGLVAVSLSACGSDSDPAPSEPGGVGQIFNLVIGDDNLTGTEFADTFNALLASATGSLTGVLGLQTLGDTDIIDGGEGQDVLNAVLNGTGLAIFDYAAPAITDVEVYNLTARNDGAGLDLFNSSGYEQLWMVNSDADLTLDNVRENAALGLDGVTGGNTYYVNYTSSVDTTVQNVFANALGTSEASGQVRLDIDTAVGDGFGTLNLAVSNTVRLDLRDEAADMEVFNITGSGVTELSGEDQFEMLVELDSTGYTGDLTLDISGSGTLESVLTAGGDDVITAAAANFSADTPATTVNLGAGDNRLVLEDTFDTEVDGGIYSGGGLIDSEELSGLDFTLAPVSGVQTLELIDVDLDGDASLALEGVGGLETLVFDTFLNNSGDDFTVTGAPETLLISATEEFDMNTGLFTIEGVVDLTMETPEANNVFDTDIRINGGLNSETLETLVINAGDDAELEADGGLDALTSLEVNGLGDDADVDLENANGEEFAALTSVTVTAADDADLEMTGRAPVQQVQTFTAGGAALVFPGTITFEYVDADGNLATVSATNEGAGVFTNGNATAANIAAAFNALPEFTATSSGAVATIVRVDGGVFPEIDLDAVTGGRAITDNGITVDGVNGAGFEATETIVVSGEDTATVNLTDVYGNFTLDVTAEGTLNTGAGNSQVDTAVVNLTNTGVTEASVAGGSEFDYNRNIDGDVISVKDIDYTRVNVAEANGGTGNQDLTVLTVSGAATEVTLSGDLSSFTTLDLTGAANWFSVNASGAEYDLAVNEFVTYLIGGTSSEWGGSTATGGDSQITLNALGREAVTFTDGDFGTVVINGFVDGSDPVSGDRIDLSQLGFTSGGGQINFAEGYYNAASGVWDTTNDAGDVAAVRITDLNGGPGAFSGEIIVTGITDSTDLATFNIVYA